MKLKSLSILEFDEFAKSHPLGSYHQSSNYALLASEQGFDYDMLGLIDDEGNIQAAALILIKKIGFFNRYGYSPKGFLIDYYNPTLLKDFLDKIKKYYYKKNVAFIKINPEISIGTLDYKNKKVIYNKNQMIESTLKGMNFRKLDGIKRFESKLPVYNAIQVLKTTNLKTVAKNTRNKINKSSRLGMKLVKGNRESIKILYKFIQKKKNYDINHYFNYFNAFSKNNSIDVFLVEIDFEECLLNLREKFEKESERNEKIVNLVMNNPSKENLKRKMDSDNTLSTISNSIVLATNHLAKEKKSYIAGAITIKYKNRVSILISGYDKNFNTFCPNYFLHYELIKYYKEDYDYIDLNGITGDFSTDNPYRGLDEFKLSFNPLTFEYIGEFDFILNEGLYRSMDQSGQLAKEFQKKEKSIKN